MSCSAISSVDVRINIEKIITINISTITNFFSEEDRDKLNLIFKANKLSYFYDLWGW